MIPGFMRYLHSRMPFEASRTRSCQNGYHIEAKDGEIGHVQGFVINDDNGAVRYIEVAPGIGGQAGRYWFHPHGFKE